MRRLIVCIGIGAVIALALSTLAFSLITMFRHEWLQKAEPIVCPDAAILELRNASPVPGELVLEASCTGARGTLDVTGKLIATVAGVFFVPTLLVGTVAVWLRG